MAGGNNNAKQIVIGEAKCLADKLQNGSAGCVETQGRAIALLVKMITPIYEAEFVTVSECSVKHKAQIAKVRSSRIKIGPVEFEGVVSTTVLRNIVSLVQTVAIVFIIGRSADWW